MSHVSEKFYATDEDVIEAQRRLKKLYRNSIAPAEVVAILILRSDIFRELLRASGMRQTIFTYDVIIDKVCACIAGSKFHLGVDAYLGEIINGPVDCDKVDYLARDAHMAGLPISLDIDRLFSKLRIVRTNAEDGSAIFSLAIVPSGARALEEMLVSRIFLYDKFYYHPKLMAAEELIRRALYHLGLACPILKSPVGLLEYGDDEFLNLTPTYIAGRYEVDAGNPNIAKGCRLLTRARRRDLPKRAFAFARRFIPEMPTAYARFVNEGRDDAVPQSVNDFIQFDKLVQSSSGAEKVAGQLEAYARTLDATADVFLGYQSAQRAAGKMDMPVLLPGGVVERTPDFLFNVSKWSDAYALNKQTSYVFAYEALEKVYLSSERYFGERKMMFAPKSRVWSKLNPDTIRAARSSLPETEEWLPHRLPPDYLEGDAAHNRILALEGKFASYLRAFDPQVGPELVKSWVWQFGDPDLQDSALMLLEHLTFLEKRDIVQGFDAALRKRESLKSAVWVPLRAWGGGGESADLIRYDLKELGLEMKEIAALTVDDITKSSGVVFFDDLLNSGVQSACLLNSWFETGICANEGYKDAHGSIPFEIRQALQLTNVDFVFYSAHPNGINRLKSAREAAGLARGDILYQLDTSDKQYTLAGFRAASKGSRERFMKELQTVGKRLLTETFGARKNWPESQCEAFALGFDNLQMTLLYRHSVSTAMPVALWQMSTDLISPWLPLFPRKWRELSLILNPRQSQAVGNG